MTWRMLVLLVALEVVIIALTAWALTELWTP